MATAAPEIRDVSLATEFVDGTTDYFEFAPGSTTAIGTMWKVTGPDGTSHTFTLTTIRPTCTPYVPVRFYLDSPEPDSISCSTDGWVQTINEAFNGKPADGTWTIQLFPNGAYQSNDGTPGSPNYPGPTLSIQSKAIHFSTQSASPNQWHQSWNWHQTTGTWNEPSTVPSCAAPCPADTATEGPEEDPNNAVFFSDTAGPEVSPFTAYTLQFTVTCGASAGLHTMSITGAWLGATGTAFSSHIYRDGNSIGTTDLRSIPGATTTTEENEGTTPAGTDTETAIPYNNAAGTSYQFRIRTATQGEQLGAVAYAPAGACTPAAPAALLTFSNTVFLSISQAQCRNDPVSFSIDVDLTVAVSLNDIDLVIYNAQTGATLANYDEATMFNTQAGQVFIMADVFLPGAYVAQAVADVGGVGAVDLFDSAAFSVPEGDCIWREPDLSGIYQALSLLEGNLTEILDTLEIVFSCSQNCTINANLTTLQQILENVTQHRNNTLEVMGMSFNDMGFDGFLFFLLWIAAWFFAALNRYYWLMALATLGIVESILPEVLPFTWQEWAIFYLIVLLLQFWAEGRHKGLGSKDLGAFEQA